MRGIDLEPTSSVGLPTAYRGSLKVIQEDPVAAVYEVALEVEDSTCLLIKAEAMAIADGVTPQVEVLFEVKYLAAMLLATETLTHSDRDFRSNS